jgi:uncharacterized membrane protein YhdT
MDPQIDPSEHNSLEKSFSDPYPLSWVDRVNNSFRNSRVPSPFLYLAIGIGAMLVGQIALWFYGITPRMLFDSVSFAVGIWVSLSLAFVHYLDDLARKALEDFRPALDLSNEAFAQLRFRLTTMPGRPLVLMNLVTALVTILANILYPDIFETLIGKEVQVHPILLVSAAALGVSGSLIYHTIRQLAIIRSLYASAPRLSIFDAKSTYAFSTLTVSTALAWALILYLGILTVPGIIEHPVWVAVSITILLMIFISIGSVLLRINRKLTEEKDSLKKEVTNRLVKALSLVHQSQDKEDLIEIENLGHLVQTLSHERDLLLKIPTWPWRPGTVVAFISALFIPVTIFLIQELIRRFSDL